MQICLLLLASCFYPYSSSQCGNNIFGEMYSVGASCTWRLESKICFIFGTAAINNRCQKTFHSIELYYHKNLNFRAHREYPFKVWLPKILLASAIWPYRTLPG